LLHRKIYHESTINNPERGGVAHYLAPIAPYNLTHTHTNTHMHAHTKTNIYPHPHTHTTIS